MLCVVCWNNFGTSWLKFIPTKMRVVSRFLKEFIGHEKKLLNDSTTVQLSVLLWRFKYLYKTCVKIKDLFF